MACDENKPQVHNTPAQWLSGLYSKLSFGNQFDQDLMEKTGKQGIHFLMTSTVFEI